MSPRSREWFTKLKIAAWLHPSPASSSRGRVDLRSEAGWGLRIASWMSVSTQRYTSPRYLLLVMRGLDPRIHRKGLAFLWLLDNAHVRPFNRRAVQLHPVVGVECGGATRDCRFGVHLLDGLRLSGHGHANHCHACEQELCDLLHFRTLFAYAMTTL